MAEYYALLTKAVGGLNPNTVDARRGVYDKARQALIAQLKAINPPLPAAVISKQRLELEEAVRRVEREAAAGVAAETGDISQAAARAMEEALAAGSDSGGASAWGPEPVRDPGWGAPPEPPPPPRRSAGQRIVEGAGRREPLAEDRSETVRAPQPEPASRRRAEPVIDVEVADLDDVPPPPPPRGRAQPVRAAWADLEDASGGAPIAGLDEERPRGRAARRAARAAAKADRRERSRRRSRWPGIITTVLILLVLGGVGAAIALNWDKVSDLISSFDQAADDEGPPLLAEPGAAEANAANPQPAAPAEDVRVVGAPQQPDVGLGQANPAAPANDALALAPAEEAGAPAAEAAAAAGAGAAAVADGNRAVLYEQIAETNDATRLEGRVSWRTSVVDGTTTLVANISVPERGLTIVLSFEPSGDTFVLNILFGLPEGFVGGGIDQVPRVVAKPEETVSGAELATAASPFPPDFFRLLFVEEAEASNLEALRANEWFDLPVLYATGQRAIVSFQKGEEGREAVETALAAWTGQ